MQSKLRSIWHHPAVSRHHRKFRFAIVGVVNTGLDFGLFLALGLLGLNAVVANYISTSCALSFSFVANRKYTFQSAGKAQRREIILFLGFTLFGLWVLQPIAIWLVERATVHAGLTHVVVLVLSKGVATVITLTWNYLTYSRFVFTDQDPQKPGVANV